MREMCDCLASAGAILELVFIFSTSSPAEKSGKEPTKACGAPGTSEASIWKEPQRCYPIPYGSPPIPRLNSGSTSRSCGQVRLHILIVANLPSILCIPLAVYGFLDTVNAEIVSPTFLGSVRLVFHASGRSQLACILAPGSCTRPLLWSVIYT